MLGMFLSNTSASIPCQACWTKERVSSFKLVSKVLGQQNTRTSHLQLARAEASVAVDKDFVEELNKVSNDTLEVLTASDEDAALKLSLELEDMRRILEEVEDKESSQFLRVLQALLNHRVPKELDELQGLYARATDRILNQIAGSPWKLVEEGNEQAEEPKFSTWDGVFKKPGSSVQNSGGVKDTQLYRVLGVESDAQTAEIKGAFRKLALKLHPDVSDASDANERFAALSEAYDVLSDPETRKVYDEVGMTIINGQTSVASKGNARKAWDEFKPYIRQNKHTRARASSQTQSPDQPSAQEPFAQAQPQTPEAENEDRTEPAVGDVVEYPLRTIETEDFNDGRSHGVGLLVSRNKDRGDAKTLPEDQLSLCEVESLRQEEPDSDRWVADELGITSFAKLEDMRVIPVADFNSRHDIWTITSELSPGCGGPPLPEEVIL